VCRISSEKRKIEKIVNVYFLKISMSYGKIKSGKMEF